MRGLESSGTLSASQPLFFSLSQCLENFGNLREKAMIADGDVYGGILANLNRAKGMGRSEWRKALSWKVWSFAFFLFASIYFAFLSFFLSFFLPDFWYVLWVGVEMFLKKAQTLWLAVYLSSSSLSLHTKIQKKKKIMVDVREIDGCRFEILFYLLIFWYYKIMVLGKIRDYWN